MRSKRAKLFSDRARAKAFSRSRAGREDNGAVAPSRAVDRLFRAAATRLSCGDGPGPNIIRSRIAPSNPETATPERLMGYFRSGPESGGMDCR